MATFDDYRLMSAATYGNDSKDAATLTGENWIIQPSLGSNGTGYYNAPDNSGFSTATYFQYNGDPTNPNSKITNVVIAFRGTDASSLPAFVEDAYADSQLVAPYQSTQEADAIAYFKSVINYLINNNIDPSTVNISFTGHSLGGELADYMGALTGLNSVSFDAAGALTQVSNAEPTANRFYSNINNYILTGDIIPALLAQIGTDHYATIPPIDTGNPVQNIVNEHLIPIAPNLGVGETFSQSQFNGTVTTGINYFVGSNLNNVLVGTSGNDTFVGGAGNDTIYGGAGNDLYQYNPGNGQDKIISGSPLSNANISQSSGNDTLEFGAGFSIQNTQLASLSLNSDPSTDLQITVTDFEGGTGSVTIEDQLTAGDVNHHINHIVFSDGEIQTGTLGNDALNFTGPNQVIYGFGGSDLYTYNRGDGADAIVAGDANTPTENDTLNFGPGIDASNLLWSISGNDLTLSIAGTTDSVTISNELNASAPGAHVAHVTFQSHPSENFDLGYESNGSLTIKNNTTGTILGNNTLSLGSNDNIGLASGQTGGSVQDTVTGAAGANLKTDTLVFEGQSIAGVYSSGDTDALGRTYTLNGTTLTVTDGTDSLTIPNFEDVIKITNLFSLEMLEAAA